MPIKIKTLIVLLILSTIPVLPQETDIVPYLKEIENGDKESAIGHLQQLEKKSPGDGSVKFLKGVLTEDGQKAADIYTDIVKNHPKSKYADAALYRLYTYYYALSSYETAENHLKRLKRDYPYSPYIKLASEKVPVSVSDESLPEISTAGKNKNETTKPYLYTIQAGAFSNAANAAALKKDFEKSGFQSEVREKNVGGTLFQVVYVGKFRTEDEAKSFLQLINSEFKLDGRVVNIN
jgi:tetratricopeptide (TPR) repeat protein